MDQFRGVSAKALGVAGTPARVDPQVAADFPTRLLQSLGERRHPGLSQRIVRSRGHQHADAAQAARLLRAYRERPRSRHADKADEVPPPHGLPPRAEHHARQAEI